MTRAMYVSLFDLDLVLSISMKRFTTYKSKLVSQCLKKTHTLTNMTTCWARSVKEYTEGQNGTKTSSREFRRKQKMKIRLQLSRGILRF